MELNTSIEVINVLELDEVISKMTLQLKLTVEWIDSRLEYVDLKRPVLLVCHKIFFSQILTIKFGFGPIKCFLFAPQNPKAQ